MELATIIKFLKENKTITIMGLFIVAISTLWGVDRLNQSTNRKDLESLRGELNAFRAKCDLDKKNLYAVILTKDSTFRDFIINQNEELKAEARRTDSLAVRFNQIVKNKLK